VLDVLFCGLTLAAIRYHEASNMPFWKIDKHVRKLAGPNPFRAHDVIGTKGSNFLTWSCLHHLSKAYGELFEPGEVLSERKESGESWYPMQHLRPVVNWSLDAGEMQELRARVLGALFHVTSLILKEKRSHPAQINAISELCAQFQPGILAAMRAWGARGIRELVEAYHRLHPSVAEHHWYPEVFDAMDSAEWRQLYVNAEHDGSVGVITIGRESYSSDVDAELNRAMDWLRSEKIERVIVTGDFHLATQMTGADVSNFFEAVESAGRGEKISAKWSQTARRLHGEFKTSVGFVNGKRCLGGLLELLAHCHYVVAVDTAELGMPEVGLPVVPGMEGCHWLFRRTSPENWPKLLGLLLEGRAVKAADAVGWLLDFAGSRDEAIRACWEMVTGKAAIVRRCVDEGPLSGVTEKAPTLATAGATVEAARRAIMETVEASCAVSLEDALRVQAQRSGDFMGTAEFRSGAVGTAYRTRMEI
jgi:enoyl-CoA hydratase/carnithine racemase